MFQESSKPRVTQVFNRYTQTGGEENSVDRIYGHLADGFLRDKCVIDSAEWTGRNAPSAVSQVRRMFYNRDTAVRLEERLDAFAPDALLFHNVFPVGSPSLFRVARKRQVPIIQYLHNFRPFSVSGSLRAAGRNREEGLRGNFLPEILGGSWQNSRIKTAILAAVLKQMHVRGDFDGVACWVAISDFIRNKFIAAGIAEDRIFTLRHSWDPLTAPPSRGDAPAYLMMCRLVEEKGVRVALTVWNELVRRVPAGAETEVPELWIAGKGPLEHEVIRTAATNPRIRFLGFADSEAKVDLLNRCRAVLAPSLWFEPLGLVVYEAYDYRKPILAARSGGLEETVVNGTTGWLHTPGDVKGLLEDVMRIEAASPANREAMGESGREWLLANTSADQWKKEFRKIWDSTVAR